MRHVLSLIASIVTACSVADDDVTRFFNPSKPTYQQVERLIATTQEANGETVDWPYIWTNRTAYATPTYGQVERLISEVQKGTKAPELPEGVDGSALIRKDGAWTAVPGYGYVKSEVMAIEGTGTAGIGKNYAVILSPKYASLLVDDTVSIRVDKYTNGVYAVTYLKPSVCGTPAAGVSFAYEGIGIDGTSTLVLRVNVGSDSYSTTLYGTEKSTESNTNTYHVYVSKHGDVVKINSEFIDGYTKSDADVTFTKYDTTTGIAEYVVTDALGKIKINGQALSPNVTITTYAPFKDEWVTSSSSGIDAFFSKVAADADVKKGTAFLGALKGSSTPWGSGNAEAELKVMENANGTLIYVVTVYSTDISPYFWFNMSVAGGRNNGWRKYALDGSGGCGITHEDATNAAVQVVKDDVADWALTGSTAPLTNVTINGTALEVADRKAVGTLSTCCPFPEGTATGTGFRDPAVSTLQFCKSLATNESVVAGMMYFGHVKLSEAIDDIFPGYGEVTVRCLHADRDPNTEDHITSEGSVLLMLERTSTNTGARHWMCAYELFGADHDLRKAYPDGMPNYGTTDMPWYAIHFKPIPGHNDGQVPLPEDQTAATMSDLANSIRADNEAFSNAVMNVTVGLDLSAAASSMTPPADTTSPFTAGMSIAALLAALVAAVTGLRTGKVSTTTLSGNTYNLRKEDGLRNAVQGLVAALGGVAINIDTSASYAGDLADQAGVSREAGSLTDVAEKTGKPLSDDQTVGNYIDNI